MRLLPPTTNSPSTSTVWIAPRATDEENEFGTRIDRTEGDRSWSAPPPQRWTLRPPVLQPLPANPRHSLALHCLENIALNITRYEPASFHGVGERYMRMIWAYLEERVEASKMETQEQEGRNGHPWAEQDLFLWLLHLQTQPGPSRSAGETAGGSHRLSPKPKHHTQLVTSPELLAYLPTSSPLTILQIAPTPTYTLLTSLSLSTPLLTDTTITSLRNLPYLFFLVLQACPAVTDAGIKSLAMSLDYDQAILGAKPGEMEGRGRGCWRLRGVWLDGCKRVTDNAVRDLVKWPLLNVLSLVNTGIRDQPTFPRDSRWFRATSADAAFSIPRIASPYHYATSDAQISKKFRAYRTRWPAQFASANVGTMEVVGLGEDELRRFKGERVIKRRIEAIKRDTGQQTSESPAAVSSGGQDSEVPSAEPVDLAWRMDPSMTFTTNWKAMPRWKPGGRARTGGLSESACEMDWLYLRPPPTIETVRQDLLDKAAIRSRPQGTSVEHAQVRSVVQAKAPSSSPFALSSQPEAITLQKRKGRSKQLVSTPFQIPQTKLRASHNARLDDWDAAAPSSTLPAIRTASQALATEESSSAPIRTKGFSMFKKVKR